MNDGEKRHLEDMLDRDDKKASEASGILSKVFRKVLAEIGVTPSRWNQLMHAYLEDPRNRVPRNPRMRSSTRGNLNKELSKPNMTWNNFEKGIRFLNPIKAEFTIKLSWRGGKNTVHKIVLGEAPGPDDPEDNK